MDLSGKRILVTGASSGIGKEVSTLINELGAAVIMVARNEERLKGVMSRLGGDGNNYYPYDLRNISGIETLMNDIVAENGVLSGLVHCAGISTMRPLQNTTYEFFHDMLLINLYSFIELVRTYAKKKNNKGGSVVAISSVMSNVAEKARTAYCASKAAVDGAMRGMASELVAKSIRINSVAASFIKTDMLEEYSKTAGDDAIGRHLLDRQAMGLGEPADIANAVAYLLSDAAKFITGSCMVVDGGYLSIK